MAAILLGEPEAPAMASAIAGDARRLLSAFSLLEAAIVLEARKGPVGGRELDLFLHRMRADVVPFTESQAEIARAAWRKYGRGKHPANLNIGDCAAYALSRSSGEPLLWRGKDFPRTDVARAEY